ncbi:MAG TPA: hypothetical protein VEQ85_02470 [Lacipirellulaceae bacterium]|nr:hypothetical protein [Lacipirellulaceae bacterium]
MGTTISPTLGSSQLLQSYRRNHQGAERALERLSTGKRINRPSDDPSGFVAAEQLRSEVVRLQAELKTINGRRSAVRSQSSSLTNIQQQLSDLRGLIAGAAGSVLTAEERELYDEQISQALASVEQLRQRLADNPTGVEAVDVTTPSALPPAGSPALSESVALTEDAAIFSRAALAAHEKYDLAVREELLQNMIVTHSATLSHVEDADIAEEASNLAISQTLAEGALAAISLSGSLAAQQIDALLAGIAESPDQLTVA